MLRATQLGGRLTRFVRGHMVEFNSYSLSLNISKISGRPGHRTHQFVSIHTPLWDIVV